MRSLVAILFFVFIFDGVTFGSALKCYTCSSVSNEKCRTDATDKTIDIMDCIDENYVCMTLDIDNSYERMCSSKGVCDEVKNGYCTTCNTDLCNNDYSAGGAFVPNYTTSLMIFAALYISLKVFL